MKAFDVVGYTYQAENYTPNGIMAKLDERAVLNVEFRLDILAVAAGIDRYDENSFDSDEFPKVIFADQVFSSEKFVNEYGEYVNPLD